MIIPQSIATIATVAAGAATFILSAASMSNMYETYSLVQQHGQQLQLPTSTSTSAVSKAKEWTSADEALKGLSSMNKKDLVELFLHCEAPSESDLAFCDGDQDGNWRYDGHLLDNGPILTPVTNFITNKLFGRGQTWLGKAYMKPTTSASNSATGGIGRNRFTTPVAASSSSPSTPDEALDRRFDYSIGKSVLPSTSSPKSLFNIYAPHCPIFSSPMSLVWRGMVDELRVLEIGDGRMNNMKRENDKAILLGMGYFQWSGGVWNMAPFCLVARRSDIITLDK